MENEPVYSVVNFGIDSLWLNVSYGIGDDFETVTADPRPLDETVVERLSLWQEMARVEEKPIPTDYDFDGSCLLMYGNGGGLKSPWRFILRNAALEVKIGVGKRNGLIGKVRLSAEYLWKKNDLLDGIYQVHTFMMALFDAMVYLQVSRCDPCVDVAGHDFGRGDWQDGFIRRCGINPHFDVDGIDQDERPVRVNEDENQDEDESLVIVGPDQVHMRYRPITGFSFGSRKSALSAIVYNKSNYIKYKKPESIWFHDLWKQSGWDGTSDVWRVEFHLCREALHSFSLESAYDLPQRLNALWEYCTIQWLRYAVPCLDTNRSRWEMHPVWRVVQQAYTSTLTMEQIELGPVVRERKREVNKVRMVAQVTGCLITLHAWDKDSDLCECDDLSLVLHRFYDNAQDYMERKGREFNAEVRYKQRLYSLVAA